jgi:hypothetical protein
MHSLRSFALLSGIVGLGLVAGCATETTSAIEGLAVTQGDVAPACAGILGYVADAPLAGLDSYLPSNVAAAIVARRAQDSFDSLAELSAVAGIGPARLEQIGAAARAAGWIDDACAGVYEELALSAEEAAHILAFVDQASESQLATVAGANGQVVPQLLAGRPFATVRDLANARYVGPATLRALRDASTDGPLELLAADVSANGRDVELATVFGWYQILVDEPGYPAGITCFGIDEALVASLGGEVRPALADSAEVVAEVASAVSYADRFGDLTLDPADGIADLAARTDGHSFAGCYLRYHPDPWSGINRAFFFDPDSSVRVFVETRWAE